MRSRRAALAAVTTTTLLGLSPVHAQEAPSNDTTLIDIQEIIVTGSRIRRSDTATAAPITVIDQQALADRGFVSISQALNETTAITPARAQSLLDGSGSGGGEQYPQLFGLGAGRTLTLVNGRRMVTSAGSFSSGFGNSSNDSVVDTNLIPTGLLRSVEIVQGGGAAVYGSDAMGGVVNYIYKDDFEGLEIDAQYGNSEDGDYETPAARVTWGMNFAERGNIAVNLEWSKTDPLLPEDRMDATRFLTGSQNDLNTGPNDGQPSLVRIADARFWMFNQAGILFTPPNPAQFPNRAFITTDGLSFINGGTPAQLNADGTALVAYNPGVFPTRNGPSIPFASGGDGFDYRSLSALTTGIERTNANLIGHYDLTDKIRLSTELLYAKTEGEDPRASIPSNTILNAAATGSGPIIIRGNNAFLTSDVRNSIVNYLNTNFGPGAGNAWAANAPVPLPPVALSKSWVDLLPSSVGEREVDTFRAVLALDGDFSAANRDFYWTVSATHATVDGSTRTWGVWQDRYNNAINSVLNGSGAPVCAINADADPTNDDPSCSPINPFGIGNVSADARNYVSARFGMDYENTQQDYLATLGGDVMYLPAGPMRFSVGFEHRKEEAEFKPLASDQAGIGRLGVPTLPQEGEYDTNEFSAELLIPILGQDFNLPGAETVELTGAFRNVDHSIAGTESVWNAGLRWSIVQDFTVRYSRSRNFRAPNLTQLFAPTVTNLATITIDPCDADRINGGPNPAVRLANCQAVFAQLGVDLNGFQSNAESFPSALVTTGGNPNLDNEISDTTSFGFIFEPSFAEGLTVIVDRIEIDLEDGLSLFQPQDFLATCFDTPGLPADICGISTRDANGQVVTSAAQTINAGSIRYRGENYNVNYAFPVGPGNLFLGVEATHTSELETSVTGLDRTRTDGTTAQPDWRGRFDARYGFGSWRLAYTLNYLPSVLTAYTATIETTDVPTVDANYRHSVSAQFDVTDQVTVRAGVENFTDEMPSYPTASYGDIIGRQYWMGVRAKF
ncbi:TonB-dependent receptor [Steroidobacter sp. S1-65]|uniref:TonB-dependent receptor n=1 Tax=Steroidobacter gossypii TaxID=2805490 RepID=A0ABS1WWA6_9GAMM|nr:TonB-dependent receptor [Steroidobacter gossypii]MBM0105259.1 TonB-dependent receptor [Steroidobacter gossypii]